MNNKDYINTVLIHVWSAIGIDKPSNHEDICEFVLEDVTQRKGMEGLTPIFFEAEQNDVKESLKRFFEREPDNVCNCFGVCSCGRW